MEAGPSLGWLTALRRYLLVLALGNLLWEIAQLPLYMLWHDASAAQIIFAVLHCTAGDVLIGTAALVEALVVLGKETWPSEQHFAVLISVVVLGASYTVISEYLNTVVRGSWAYTELMPRLPWIGTGVSPLLQWTLVPTLALTLARSRAKALSSRTAVLRSFQGD